jgi:hypothetical protein
VTWPSFLPSSSEKPIHLRLVCRAVFKKATGASKICPEAPGSGSICGATNPYEARPLKGEQLYKENERTPPLLIPFFDVADEMRKPIKCQAF